MSNHSSESFNPSHPQAPSQPESDESFENPSRFNPIHLRTTGRIPERSPDPVAHLPAQHYSVNMLVLQHNLYLKGSLDYRLFNEGLLAGLSREFPSSGASAYQRGYRIGLSN